MEIRHKWRSFLLVFIILVGCSDSSTTSLEKPLRVGIVGLVHTHVHWILGREEFGDIEIVGIAEPNSKLAKRYSKQHGFDMEIVYSSMEEMVEATRPEAVLAFNTIYDHLSVVEYCAPRGIHVMVEKPMAVNLDHAIKMDSLAREHDIHLLTNYETSWYGSNYEAFDLVNRELIGPIRRMVFHHGHQGPKEIGVNKEFLEWLTDPELNGGGALTDFGCYGANLATWFMDGQSPETVTCIRQNIKPAIYPNVDDEATIVLEYPQTQVIIQASWNWSHNRKDMEVYGTYGYIICKDASEMEILEDEEEGSYRNFARQPTGFHQDPFSYLAGVIREEIDMETNSVSSLENNLRVMQILEAARISADEGRTVLWSEVDLE